MDYKSPYYNPLYFLNVNLMNANRIENKKQQKQQKQLPLQFLLNLGRFMFGIDAFGFTCA